MPAGSLHARSEPLPADLAAALDRCRPRLGVLSGPLSFYSVVGSTNDIAAGLVSAGRHEGAVVIAAAQTAGRGRHGRSWFSPPVGGLYVSVVLAPASRSPDPARATALLTLAAGVAIAEGIELAAGLPPGLKWPNDVQIAGRKVAGILAERITTGAGRSAFDAIVLGFGINVGPMTLPPALAEKATSLERELGRPVDRAAVLAETLAAVARRYDDLVAGRFDAILDAWRARAGGFAGRRVCWNDGEERRAGTAVDVDGRGALLVGTERGVERVLAGEVDWV
jgi:BirA family biotin operon repressor/biotin-[acetyl-CoA-carboxylase] ligase